MIHARYGHASVKLTWSVKIWLLPIGCLDLFMATNWYSSQAS